MVRGISILWRRTDKPGHEFARIYPAGSSWRLEGTAVFSNEANPCRLDYSIVCDSEWRTQSALVEGWVGSERKRFEITAGPERNWELNGIEIGAVGGCSDIDLGFSPSTNLLPIRRLQLWIGQSAEVTAAWLRFPSFEFEPLEQVYRRESETSCHYSSGGGTFSVELTITPEGVVTRYPGFFELERSMPDPPSGGQCVVSQSSHRPSHGTDG
jgi:hypothetical protein